MSVIPASSGVKMVYIMYSRARARSAVLYLRRTLPLLAAAYLVVASTLLAASEGELFEKEIRPILAEKCQACHGSKEPMGGLDLVSAEGFRIVPTADVNTTFALALTVWALMIIFAISAKGVGGFLHELTCAPFGVKPLWMAPLLVVFNLLFNLVEYISKPLSHSLRLFGNMYAGEILFLLIWLLASTGIVGTFFAFWLGLGWAIFHILIVLLQAYIFMMLTIVYISMAHEHH